MADEDNLTDEERAELANPVIEDEDAEIEDAPDEDLDTPSDLDDVGVEDDSDFLEEVVDDGDPLLEQPDGTRISAGSVA